MAPVGKRECSPGSLHTVPSAALSSTKEWYQSRCHWIIQIPQILTTSAPEQMRWQAHACHLASTGPLGLSWCPDLTHPCLSRGMEKSSVGSRMLMKLLPVRKYIRDLCSPSLSCTQSLLGCWRALSPGTLQCDKEGRLGWAVHVTAVSALLEPSDGGRTSFGMWH